jgi:adenylate kinase family enzyme
LKAYLMALKLFILGLPGSGKSTISRQIATYLKGRNWDGVRCSDHIILKEMFLADTEHIKFEPTEHEGFDVIDITMVDIALQKLEQWVDQICLSAKQEEIVLIEFARNDYRRAFQQFSVKFLYDAYFLYLDTDLKICKERIIGRIVNPGTEDDFYVSENIFSTYYNEDDGRSIPQILENDHVVGKERVIVIDNNGSLSDSIAQVYQFVDTMCGLEPLRDS